jgi:hypothetical protein
MVFVRPEITRSEGLSRTRSHKAREPQQDHMSKCKRTSATAKVKRPEPNSIIILSFSKTWSTKFCQTNQKRLRFLSTNFLGSKFYTIRRIRSELIE